MTFLDMKFYINSDETLARAYQKGNSFALCTFILFLM